MNNLIEVSGPTKVNKDSSKEELWDEIVRLNRMDSVHRMISLTAAAASYRKYWKADEEELIKLKAIIGDCNHLKS